MPSRNNRKPKIVKVGPDRVWAGNPKGTLGGKAPSSTRQPRAVGIKPGKPAYGVRQDRGTTTERLRAKASRLFGTRRSTPNGQVRLSGKAKRQVQ